ncbi:MAG: CRTAC1 family protein [Planctomycetota bacterium]|nr:CRTAC1 family protein [Planctomycetota bacterium]
MQQSIARYDRFFARGHHLCLLALGCVFVGGVVAIGQEPQLAPGFVDRTAELGLQLANSQACWVDADNDGWSDLCAGGVVWRNNAGKGFTKLAEGFGEVVAADFDNDGFADLFSWSSVRVYRNKAGEGFEPVEMPTLPKCVSRGACWGDFNGDGFVDVYVGGYEDWDAGITYPDLLLMNEQGKSFKLTWSDSRFRARGVTTCDFDQDGDLDVYVSDYRLQPNVLWLNDGKGEFKDATADANALGTSPGFGGGHSIGAAWGDFDDDGKFDLFAGNFAHVDGRGDQPKSRFLRNQSTEKGPTFEDRGPCGVYYQESYASPSAGDFDNDGDLDLFFTTVYETASFGRKNNPVLFRNDGGFAFADATPTAKLTSLPATYQAAWADFDHDGDLDLVTAGKLFENLAPTANWLELRLEGDGSAVNRSAIGAQARIQLTTKILSRQVEAGTGEGNQNDLVLHFGLGDHATPVRVDILWPNSGSQTIENVEINRSTTVRFGKQP